jgi:hypothetical protein
MLGEVVVENALNLLYSDDFISLQQILCCSAPQQTNFLICIFINQIICLANNDYTNCSVSVDPDIAVVED